ncbi:MAG TPA: ASPIC/UnbV domain-containing protein, partial [Isosphaeraceae bacterium]|nr:ASPIC/UnbV domain-containing protein [Isosphaeraceae bacterium]
NVPMDPRTENVRRFELVSSQAGPYFEASHVGRGASFGDLDNDGDTDIVLNPKDGRAAILRNDSTDQGHWLRFQLRATQSQPDLIGSKIQVVIGPRTVYRQKKGGGSLEGSNDPRPLVGVGPQESVETVIVRWPSGRETVLKDVRTDQTLDLTEPE